MTEAEWLACNDPTPMLTFLGPHTERKYRLAACACCRRLWYLLTDLRSQRAVELAERVADQVELEIHLPFAKEEARKAVNLVHTPRDFPAAAAALTVCHMPHGIRHIIDYAGPPPDEAANLRPEQCDLLRDIFGNPFRPVTFSPSWRTDTTLSLAAQMYDSRDFSAMPILADALQDAGCDNADILNHCRDTTVPHVRAAGSWTRCWARGDSRGHAGQLFRAPRARAVAVGPRHAHPRPCASNSSPSSGTASPISRRAFVRYTDAVALLTLNCAQMRPMNPMEVSGPATSKPLTQSTRA